MSKTSSMRRLLKESSFSIPGFKKQGMGRYAASSTTKTRGGRIGVEPNEPTLPFRYQASRDVYEIIKTLSLDMPAANPEQLVRRAIEMSPYATHEITAEDQKLLVMSIEFLQNGFQPDLEKGHPSDYARGGIANWHTEGVGP